MDKIYGKGWAFLSTIELANDCNKYNFIYKQHNAYKVRTNNYYYWKIVDSFIYSKLMILFFISFLQDS